LAESKYVYRNLAKGDEDAVKGLLKRSSIQSDWEWKYLHNPSFDPCLVAIAEENAKIVGCNHWLLQDIKLSSSSVGKAILSGDIAVDPKHRKRGIGKSLLLFLRSSSLSNARGAVLTYMFATPELSKRLYQPTVGYVPIATSTVTYGRRWSWKQFIRAVDEANVNLGRNGEFGGKSVKRNLKVVFYVLGAPPLTIALNQGRIEAFQGDVEGPTLRVKSDLATFGHLRRKEKRMRRLVKALLTRRLRMSGSLFGIISLYQNLPLLEEIFHAGFGATM
jgi:predicted N-acetyltransferase YhbS